jgi:hypothetical protein
MCHLYLLYPIDIANSALREAGKIPLPKHGVLFRMTLFLRTSGVPMNFFRGVGVKQIQLRIEGRENDDLGAVTP